MLCLTTLLMVALTIPFTVNAQNGAGTLFSIQDINFVRTDLTTGDEEVLRYTTRQYQWKTYIAEQDSFLLYRANNTPGFYKVGGDFSGIRRVSTYPPSSGSSGQFSQFAYNPEENTVYYQQGIFASFQMNYRISRFDLDTETVTEMAPIGTGTISYIAYSETLESPVWTLQGGSLPNVFVGIFSLGDAGIDTLVTFDGFGNIPYVIPNDQSGKLYFFYSANSTVDFYVYDIEEDEKTLISSDIIFPIFDTQELAVDLENNRIFFKSRNFNSEIREFDYSGETVSIRTLIDEVTASTRIGLAYNAEDDVLYYQTQDNQVYAFDLENETTITLTSMLPGGKPFLADDGETVYFVQRDTIWSTDYDATAFTPVVAIEPLGGVSAVRYNSETNTLYYQVGRNFYKQLVEPDSEPEWFASYPSGGVPTFDIDEENERIFMFIRNQGIYSLDYGSEAPVQLTSQVGGMSTLQVGLAYDSKRDVVIYASNQGLFSVPADGGSRTLFQNLFDDLVSRVDYHAEKDVFVFASRGSTQIRFRYRDAEPGSGDPTTLVTLPSLGNYGYMLPAGIGTHLESNNEHYEKVYTD